MKYLINPETNKPIFKSPVQFNGSDAEFSALAVSLGVRIQSPVIFETEEDIYHIPFEYLNWDGETLVIDQELTENIGQLLSINAVQEIQIYAKNARSEIVDNADPAKIGLYNARASLARAIKSNSATSEEIKTALESKYAIDNSITDENVLADIWLEMNRQMLDAGNTIDNMEKSAIAAVNSASPEQIDQLLAGLKTNAEAALPQFLGIIGDS